MVDRKLVEAQVISLLTVPRRHYCFVSPQLFFMHFFLARYIAFVSILSICLVCDSSIGATCLSIPAACFAFRLCFIHFVVLFIVSFSGEPKQNHRRGLVDRKLVQASPPNNYIAGRPKAALLFWFFGDFRCSVLLFMVILIIYIKNGQNIC